jgi:hypothetical protein
MNSVLFATYHPYEDSGFGEGYALVRVHVKRFYGSLRRKNFQLDQQHLVRLPTPSPPPSFSVIYYRNILYSFGRTDGRTQCHQ